MREVRSSDFAIADMFVRMYVLSAGLYVCMYACLVVVIKSVVLLTSIELGLGEVENGSRSTCPESVVC